VYQIRGERTGGVSYASAIKFSVRLNLVLNPTFFLIGTLECTEVNIYTYGRKWSELLCATEEIVLYLSNNG